MNKTLTAILAFVLVAAFGCGKRSDEKVSVKQEGNTVNYEVKTKDGKATIAASDTQVSIPSTFPKDVPILKGAVPKLSMTQGKTEMLHLLVNGSIGEVAKEYQDKLKGEGWEIETSMNMGESSMVQAKKGNRKCSVVVVKDNTRTLVQLSVSAE